eukprot:gnl/TRDRNA2_/TRDRNA2_164108_c0_seq1.p1 gnl/TRDRNA2_/TRDRNA2_164108_c0~~gnl/TRDRNA2_/TRDRNA2_164108_c0_seq1.p1  ORF type:complete len:248 (-),score=44.94 gnl/TRDRNA2_/TRDRNA2_164108_c0_seq1:165-908(-)
MLRHVQQLLDVDGDGEVSLADLEAVGGNIEQHVRGCCERCTHVLQYPSVRCGVGLVALFYGGHLKTTAVVFRSLEGAPLQRLKAQCSDLIEEYQRAREGLTTADGHGTLAAQQLVVAAVATGGVGAGGGGLASQPGGAVAGDPRGLLIALQALHNSVLVQVAAALNGNTARLGLGLQLGRRLVDGCGGWLETLLLGGAEEQASLGHCAAGRRCGPLVVLVRSFVWRRWSTALVIMLTIIAGCFSLPR